MLPIRVSFRSRRRERVQLLQKLNHVIPAAGLAAAGTQALAEGARRAELVWAFVEIATTVMLPVSIVQTLRTRRQSATQHSKPQRWPEIASITFQQDQRNVGEMYLVSTEIGHPQRSRWASLNPAITIIASTRMIGRRNGQDSSRIAATGSRVTTVRPTRTSPEISRASSSWPTARWTTTFHQTTRFLSSMP